MDFNKKRVTYPILVARKDKDQRREEAGAGHGRTP